MRSQTKLPRENTMTATKRLSTNEIVKLSFTDNSLFTLWAQFLLHNDPIANSVCYSCPI